ncbi:hypothetical protein DL93DRAFT_811935 [Clavulina sp. PMI_390]|nr:hypothetical protein DL93DRAFT_811935 [Clavulina sp. PMI_390]
MRRRRQQQQQRRSGHRVSQPVPHRDVWDIDPYPQPNTGGETDSDFHGHVTPYFDASDARTEMAAASEAGMASAAMYAQSSTGRSHAARTSIHTIAPSDSQSQAAFPHSPFPQSPFIAHSPQSSQQLYPPVAGPSTSAGGKERYRTQSDVSAASSRYRAPRPEQDAGPLLPVGESEESLSDDEAHAVAQETLPPMYSSIGGSHFTRNQQAAEAAARAAKAAGRPQLRVVGESSTTRDPPDEDS